MEASAPVSKSMKVQQVASKFEWAGKEIASQMNPSPYEHCNPEIIQLAQSAIIKRAEACRDEIINLYASDDAIIDYRGRTEFYNVFQIGIFEVLKPYQKRLD
jgi:hypothetical protein